MAAPDFSDVKWATCVPLIGGSAIGCSQTVGHKPEYHLSYGAFGGNEKQIEHYWPDVHRFVLDAEKFSLEDLPDTPIDFVNAVCPCAGLSMLNTKASADSEVNEWMYKSTEFVLEHIKPKVLWGENAPALYTSKGRPVAEKLAAIGRKYGYSFSMMATDCYEHGIPQHRQRTFYFLWKSRMAPILGYHHTKSVPLYEYIKQIPEDATQQDLYYRTDDPQDKLDVKFCMEATGLSFRDLIKKYNYGRFCSLAIWLAAQQNKVEGNIITRGCPVLIDWLLKQPDSERRNKAIANYRRIWNKGKEGKGFMDGSVTFAYRHLNAWVGRTPFAMIHPIENRFWNVREMLHIMGLPHDFELQNWQNSMNVVCQNVPTVTTRDMTKEVLRFIKNDPTLIFAPGNFVRQTNKHNRIDEARMYWK